MNNQVSFVKVSRQEVIGSLKAIGSLDPDVLFAAKEGMTATNKPLKLMSLIPIICGIGLTLTIIGSFIGIPMILLGAWLRRRASTNVRTIEEAFAEYVKSAGVPGAAISA